MKWCLSLADKTEFDDRFKAMPEHSNLRHFKTKVSELSQTTGKEHREMEKVFLGVIAGHLPDGVTAAARALLEFIYYAQLPTHTDMTITWLEHALADFHARKHVFIERGAREHFNINKLHSMLHYAAAIRELGALDGYNTESPERLHIDFAKRAYRATNRNDFVSQMVDYLERRERVFKFDAYLKWAIPEYGEHDRRQSEALITKKSPGWHVAKQSPFKPASLPCLESVFGVRWFDYALSEFSEKELGRNIELAAWDALTIFPKATQYLQDDLTLEAGFTDTFHASPHALMTRLSLERRGKRFDTVLIQRERADSSYGIKDHIVGEVRMIFKLPPHCRVDDPLVFVNIFHSPTSDALPPQPTGMYRVRRRRWPAKYSNHYVGQIFFLSDVRRTCHLIPEFGGTRRVYSSNSPPALEAYDSFYLNSFLDWHSFLFLQA
ncbi:Zn-finger protein, putative, partial [Rhizoctonia solani AG-3 Rhs1AP]